MYRRRRLGKRREVKAVSVEAVNAQAAFYRHYKTPSPPHNNHPESHRATVDPFPVPDEPASGSFKLVPRSTGGCAGGEIPGVVHCSVCYDVLIPGTENYQQRSHVTTETDVTRRRPVTSARVDAERYLVKNSRRQINSFNSIYSV